MSRPQVLFVFTSVDQFPDGSPCGWYLPEAAHPYYELTPSVDIDFASPKGCDPPVDTTSVQRFEDDPESVKFLNDEIVKAKFASARRVADVLPTEYDAIYYVGGYGPVYDLAGDPANAKLITEMWEKNKIVAAVCHGPAALISAKDRNGTWLFKNKRTTGFSNEEESSMDKKELLPFLLETKLKELGGKYEKAPKPMGEKVVVDGRLITGQNPASARGVGLAILKGVNRVN